MQNQFALLYTGLLPTSRPLGFSPVPAPVMNDNLKALLQYQEYCKYRQQQQLQQLYISQHVNKMRLFCFEKALEEKSTDLQTPSTYQTALSDVSHSETVKSFSPEPCNDSVEILRRHIQRMLVFFLNESGKLSQERIQINKPNYAPTPILAALYDKLAERYASSSKCREDMVRFVLRKALSSLRNSIRDQYNLSSKAASMTMCQRYFKLESAELAKAVDMEDEEQILNFLLPYKKNSRNKTVNNSFISEIFSSQAFYEDYTRYLNAFDHILEEDNNMKINRFVEFLLECVKNNTLQRIKTYKRLPWLKVWQESTKVIAFELLNSRTSKLTHKKVKCDE